MGDYHMPEFQVPAGARARTCWRSRPGRACAAAWDGPRRALSRQPQGEYVERMEHELGVIQQDGLRRLLPDRGRLHQLRASATASRWVPGRGSSAGSLVAWGLGITGIDPIEYDIIFERFLNPERVSRCRTSTSTSACAGATR